MNPLHFTLCAISSYILLCLTIQLSLTLAKSRDHPQAPESSTCALLNTANSNVTIWALGFTASHFIIVLSNQQAYRVPRTSVSTSMENSLWVNLANAQTEPFPADETTFPLKANCRGFIGRTASLGFAFSMLNSHYIKSSFIRVLEGGTTQAASPAGYQAVTLAVNLPNNPLFFSYDVPGSYLTLQGEELLEGHFDNVPTHISLTTTVIGQISRSGVLQVGFVTDGTLYVLDNQARRVSFYGLNRWIAQEPFASMSYGDVFDCDGSGPRQGVTSGMQGNNALGRLITGIDCLMIFLMCWASFGVARVLKNKLSSQTSSESSSESKSKAKASPSGSKSSKKSTLNYQLCMCFGSSKRRVQHSGPALSSRLAQCFTTYRWRPATMARDFDYTCAIMENNAFQGSLHTFLRHGSQWRRIIPNLNQSWNQLSPALKRLVEKVEKGSITIEQFLIYFAGLDQNMAVFSCIQQEILSFIQKNITQKNFLSEGLNMKGEKRVTFSVKGSGQRAWIMTVGISDRPMRANYAFSRDSRPIRFIVTVFFTPKDSSFWKWTKLILLAILLFIFVRYFVNIF